MSDTLNAGSPPQGVSPQPVLRVIVGNPPRELLMLAGVAFTDWDTSSGKLYHKEVIIKLGVTTTPAFQATSSVTLAAIYNTDSDFIFAADDSFVTQDAQGELELHVQLGVMGQKSVLLKLSYHVQVLSDPLEALVSGTIRWSEEVGEPSASAIAGAVALFRVPALLLLVGPSGGPLPGPNSWDERAATFSGPPQRLSGLWATPYVIHGIGLGERLQIVPQYLGGLIGPGAGQYAVFTPGIREIELTLAAPAMTGVDFELTFQSGPR